MTSPSPPQAGPVPPQAADTGPDVRQDYTDLASDYDQVRFQSGSGRFLAELDASIVRDMVRRTRARRVLDVPTGTGRVFDYLAREPVRVVGCDLTPGMLLHAQGRGPAIQEALVMCDASSLPFPTGSFDCLISLRFFHLFPPAARHLFVREFQRVLKPGGHLLCSFTNGWYAGGLNWLRKALGGRTVHFLMPGELKRLFPGWRVRASCGNFLPMQRHLARLAPPASAALRWLTRHSPLRALAWERYYLLERPAGAGA